MTAPEFVATIRQRLRTGRSFGRNVPTLAPCREASGPPPWVPRGRRAPLPEPETGFAHEAPDPAAAPRTASRARCFRFRWNQLVTDGHTVAAAPQIAAPGTRSRRRPVFNPPIVALRRTVPALIAAAMLLGAGAPVRAFPGLDRPSVSIAAVRGSYGFGIDDVIFRLRRAGPADDAISVRVSLTQAHLYLPTDRLNAVVRFGAGKRDAEFRIRARRFNGPATHSGALSATLVAAFDYTVGYPDSAQTRMVVKNPAITVRPEQASYTVEPDDGAVRVTFVARTEGELPRPGKAFSLAVSSKAASDETAARRVARGVSQTVEFKPRNFVSTGGKWEASRTVSISMAGTAEGLEVMFKRAASTPERIRPRNSDGTACTDDVCMVPVFMAQRDEPTLTIAAGRESYGFGIDPVVFTVTRNGTAEGEIGGLVTLTQDQNFVSSVSRTSFTIPANETSTDVELFRSLFDGDATQSGDLTATIEAGDGYAVGMPGSATVRIVVADPAVTVRAERAAYRFAEGVGEATIAVVARTAPGVPPPGDTFPVLVFSDRTSSTATVGDDYEELETEVVFGPDDFTATGGVWEARKEVSLTIFDDDVTEADETVELRLGRDSDFTPQRIRPRNADGSACADDVCTVPVTIAANDGPAVERIEITPVPPEASADHGPFYRMDDFLALPDGAVHGQGATLTFTLTLDTEVTVTGSPELVLDIYDRERRARYTGGSGTRQLTFTWTVAKGDNDPDGLEFRYLDLNSGTIRDSQGRNFVPQTLPAQRFAEHRVRGGLHAMRLEVSGSAREGEPFEIRVVRNGGYDEVAVAVVGVTDSALPHIPQLYSPALNGPGVRTLDFHDGEPSEPGVRTSARTVTPPGDGVADTSRTLTVRLVITDAGILRHTGHRIRAWYVAEEPFEVTVPVVDTGQPLAMAGLRVHETSTTEAPDAKLVFRVTLSPRSDAPVTVDYRTGDDPANEPNATAGEDYVATDGTLTFQPGETLKTVEVEVLADDHDEGHETMRLVLSNAQGARIDKASALGVIRNSGPIPKEWIARFGRTVADQILGAVESRMRAGRQPGIEMTLAGQRVGAKTGEDGRRPAANPAASAGLSDWLRGRRTPLRREGSGLRSRMSRSLAQRDLASGTSFAVTAETGRRETISLWGRGAVTRFDGRQGSLALDGEVASGMVGADWSREPGSGPGAGAWTAGMIVAHNIGKGGYAGNSAGRVEASLTGLYPWGRLALNDRTDIWGAAGYGTGELAVTPKQPGTGEYGSTIRADLDLWMAAAGLRGVLMDGGQDGLTLTGKTDALIVQTTSDAARGSDGGNLAAARATVARLRLGLEAERPFGIGDGGTLTPSVEIGLRHDGGDAETGFGMDIGGGLAWSDTARGIAAELRGRGLLTHEADGFRERGLSGSLSWDPQPASDRGPRASLTQTLGGQASGGMNALLSRDTLAGFAGNDNGDDRRRLEARFGYGFAALGDRFTSLPEIALGLSDIGSDYSLGWRLVRGGGFGGQSLALSVEAQRHEAANDDIAPEHQVRFRIDARF